MLHYLVVSHSLDYAYIARSPPWPQAREEFGLGVVGRNRVFLSYLRIGKHWSADVQCRCSFGASAKLVSLLRELPSKALRTGQ